MRYLAIVTAAILATSAPASASTLLSFEGSTSLGGWQASSEIARDLRLRTRNARRFGSASLLRQRARRMIQQQAAFPIIQQVDLSGLNNISLGFGNGNGQGAPNSFGQQGNGPFSPMPLIIPQGGPNGAPGLQSGFPGAGSNPPGNGNGNVNGNGNGLTDITAVPGPASLPLLAGALLMLGYFRRRA